MIDKQILARTLPVGFALSPVGLLFGILAAQAGWGVVEVALMAVLGFTGSGQFTYLILAHPDKAYVEYWTVFLIILGINLRYLPMALSASNPIVGGVVKGLLSHFLADESYALERKEYGVAEKAIVRFSIVFFWTLTTSVGVLLADVLPAVVQESLAGLTFPISAILILLAWGNVAAFIGAKSGGILRHLRVNKKLHAIALCVCVSVFVLRLSDPYIFGCPALLRVTFYWVSWCRQKMDENRALIGVAMLFGISLLVRVMPAFVTLPFSERTRHNIETNLPIAVFVNLIIYCIYQETTTAFFPALISIAAAFVMYKFVGLLGSVVAASFLFSALGFYF